MEIKSKDTPTRHAGTAAQATGAQFGGLKTIVAGLGLAAVAREVVSVNTEFQRLTAMLTTVTGGSQNAQAAFQMLENLALSTPATLGQLTEAFIRLRSVGLDGTEAALKSYGNTAAAMGRPLMNFIEAVADPAFLDPGDVLVKLDRATYLDASGLVDTGRVVADVVAGLA